MRPLVVVRSSKPVSSEAAINFVSSFIELDRIAQGQDESGQLDLTMTNRERLSIISADVIAKLEVIKEAIAEESVFSKINTHASLNKAGINGGSDNGAKSKNNSNKMSKTTDVKSSGKKRSYEEGREDECILTPTAHEQHQPKSPDVAAPGIDKNSSVKHNSIDRADSRKKKRREISE